MTIQFEERKKCIPFGEQLKNMDFSSETTETRRRWHSNFQVLKKQNKTKTPNCKTPNSASSKILLENEGEIKTSR